MVIEGVMAAVQQADRLEAKAGSLRLAEKRITLFEEKLARLDAVEQELELTRGIHNALRELRQEDADAVDVKFRTAKA